MVGRVKIKILAIWTKLIQILFGGSWTVEGLGGVLGDQEERVQRRPGGEGLWRGVPGGEASWRERGPPKAGVAASYINNRLLYGINI